MNFYNFNKFRKSVKFNHTTYAYGIKEENKLLQPLQVFFKDNTLKPLPEGAKFDFIGRGKCVELKSRTCRKDSYETTCISICKVEYARRHCHDTDFYFVFNFTDGLFYYKFDKSIPLVVSMIYDIPHYFIPISYLKPMNIVKESHDKTISSESLRMFPSIQSRSDTNDTL